MLYYWKNAVILPRSITTLPFLAIYFISIAIYTYIYIYIEMYAFYVYIREQSHVFTLRWAKTVYGPFVLKTI